jgi:hypothetical protein
MSPVRDTTHLIIPYAKLQYGTMLGLQGLLLALMVLSRPFAWAPARSLI